MCIDLCGNVTHVLVIMNGKSKQGRGLKNKAWLPPNIEMWGYVKEGRVEEEGVED